MAFLNGVFDQMRYSIAPKMVFIGILIFMSIVPNGIILLLVGERENTRDNAVEEVSDKWAYGQSITGPVLVIPYKSNVNTKSGTETYDVEYAYFLPEELKIDGSADTESRQRGIYSVPVYTAQVALTGSFAKPDFKTLGVSEANVMWGDANVLMGVSDMRGLQEEVKLTWDGTEKKMDSGLLTNEVIYSGVGTRLETLAADQGAHSFSMALNVRGSKDLYFAPVGSTSTVSLSSNWTSPSFDGAFIPSDYELTDEGFTANWSVLHLNRDYPQSWLGNRYAFGTSYFGVELFTPTDAYQKVTRSVKYMILFVFLTFSTFFFIEVLNKKRIHPIQYLLIGFALILFYVLLLSFSEHLSFGLSYLIATGGVVGLITGYSANVLQSSKHTSAVGGILVVLYAVLFALLQSDDYALLLGSLLLFFLLSVVMYVTRKVDWYNIKGA